MSYLERKVSRRDFLRNVGLSAAAVGTGLVLPRQLGIAQASEAASPLAVGILIDLTRCVGCESCALACKRVNSLADPTVAPTELNAAAYCFVDDRPVTGADGKTVVNHVKRQCMHCLHPACVSACTVGALTKSANGPVVYDQTRCFGCRYCQYACPFGAPTYEWKNPIGLIHKCQLCTQRLQDGQEPACSCACPTGALRFGNRESLLGQAQAQIKSNPGRYIDHVYGESEVGGTSMLYISAVPFEKLGLPVLGPEPIPRYAEAVMGFTPYTALAVAVIATGGYVLSKRREHQLVHVPVESSHRGDPQ